MMFEKFKKLKIERTIKAMIGMSRKKFDDLVPIFAAADDEIQEERLRNKEIKNKPIGGPKGVLDTHEKRLFFVLFYLKTYPTFDVLGFHFNLSAGHAHDYVESYLTVLRRSLENLNVFPKRTFENVEDFRQVVDKYNEIIVDGLEVSCVRPRDKDAQEDRYSGKKNVTPRKLWRSPIPIEKYFI
jgi:hypothetical protein